jgi:membrane protease YdiL (CAAX protease family)
MRMRGKSGILAVLALSAALVPVLARPLSPWLWLLPGGGQFYLGQDAAGTAYLAGTCVLGGWGAWTEGKRAHGELNAPLVYAQQLYVASVYSAHRDMNFILDERDRTDPAKMGSLARAPFRAEYILNPWVLGFAAAGYAVNRALIGRGKPGFSRIRTVNYLGSGYNRDAGAAVYAAYWIPLSYGAGEAEEMLFRGMLQSSWEGSLGRGGGLLAASAVFGLAHVSRLRSEESWASAGMAALAGLYLGWRYQRTGYRLGEPIAAHFWFDVAAGATVFLLDPANNPLGAKIGFSF